MLQLDFCPPEHLVRFIFFIKPNQVEEFIPRFAVYERAGKIGQSVFARSYVNGKAEFLKSGVASCNIHDSLASLHTKVHV